MVRTGPGYLGTVGSSGSSGHATKTGLDLDSLKGVQRNTRNENRYVPISHPMMQKEIRRLGNQQFMNKGLVPRATQKEER